MLFVSPLQAVVKEVASHPPSATVATDTKKVEAVLSQVPLYFIENRGQIDHPDVSYYLKGQGTTAYFTPDGVTFALTGEGKDIEAPVKEKSGGDAASTLLPRLRAGVYSGLGGGLKGNFGKHLLFMRSHEEMVGAP